MINKSVPDTLLHVIPFQDIKLEDPFWSPRQRKNATTTIFQQWNQMEETGCIDNFRIVAKEKSGFRKGPFYADSDAHKWLDAAVRIQATLPNPNLGILIDKYLNLLEKTQQSDGYLFTYNQFHFPDRRWANLQVEHELYTAGHLIEAAVNAPPQIQPRIISIVQKLADRIYNDFIDKSPHYTCGHEEIELALLQLYHVTGNRNYFNLAQQFLERRGRIPHFGWELLKQFRDQEQRNKKIKEDRANYYKETPPTSGNIVGFPTTLVNSRSDQLMLTLRFFLSGFDGKMMQQHVPIRKQTVPEGHSVRWGYLATAVAMLYQETRDPTLISALQQSWDRMVTRRLFITGGVGALPMLEGFGFDYELRSDIAYCETCAALASIFWSWEMLLATAQPQYADLIEWTLYNAVSPGIGLDGKSYLYYNPLETRGNVKRQPWFPTACCPSNISRTWASIGKYIYSVSPNGLWMHQYIGNTTQVKIPSQNLPSSSQTISIKCESSLPWEGHINLNLESASPLHFTLHLRIPSWVDRKDIVIKINGESNSIPPKTPSPLASAQRLYYNPYLADYFLLDRQWHNDQIELEFPMRIHSHYASPKVKSLDKKVAISRGSLLYCVENLDNPGLAIPGMTIDLNHQLEAIHQADLLGGITVLHGITKEGNQFRAIPYYAWANRGDSRMQVWFNLL